MKSLIPDLSIIMCTYNTKAKVELCLDSLFRNVDGLIFETIVSDNNSQDGTLELIKEKFPQVKVVENKENLGFAKANNIGIRMAKGKNILLLNGDTLVLPFAIERMAAFMDEHPRTGIAGANLLNPDDTSQRSNRRFPTPMAAFFGRKSWLTKLFPSNRFSRRYFMEEHKNTKIPYEVDWVSGACLMIKQKVIEEIGLLDEEFFMYWEDADWCHRAKKKGWRVYCLPQAKIIHDEGSSTTGKDKIKSIREFHKSAYRYYRKYYTSSFFDPMNFIAAGFLKGRTFLKLVFAVIKNIKVILIRLIRKDCL